MLYLETILKSMKANTDVIVKLSSYSTNDITGSTWQDGCGNHHVESWLDAINKYSLQKVFMIADVTVEPSRYCKKPQWIITLVNEKNSITDILDRAADRAACKRYYENDESFIEKLY